MLLSNAPSSAPATTALGRWSKASKEIRKGCRFDKIVTAAPVSEPTHFFLYLSRETWVGDSGKELAAQVRAARAVGLPIVMVHEVDDDAGGCEFGRCVVF